MSCWLCGNEDEGRHHLGCARVDNPGLTEEEAADKGLLPAPQAPAEAEPDKVEVLKEGTMTTEPVDSDTSVATCEVEGCDNPKYSDSPRTKYCEDHRDPKNRKE